MKFCKLFLALSILSIISIKCNFGEYVDSNRYFLADTTFRVYQKSDDLCSYKELIDTSYYKKFDFSEFLSNINYSGICINYVEGFSFESNINCSLYFVIYQDSIIYLNHNKDRLFRNIIYITKNYIYIFFDNEAGYYTKSKRDYKQYIHVINKKNPRLNNVLLFLNQTIDSVYQKGAYLKLTTSGVELKSDLLHYLGHEINSSHITKYTYYKNNQKMEYMIDSTCHIFKTNLLK